MNSKNILGLFYSLYFLPSMKKKPSQALKPEKVSTFTIYQLLRVRG